MSSLFMSKEFKGQVSDKHFFNEMHGKLFVGSVCIYDVFVGIGVKSTHLREPDILD